MFDLPNDDGEKEKSECNRRWCEPANRKPVMIELSKYAFETLRKDEQFAFCRGRSDEGELPTILLVAPVPEHPVPAILERLEHEYSLRDELDPEWSVRSIGLTRHWDRLVPVMEDPGGYTTGAAAGSPIGSAGASPYRSRWRAPRSAPGTRPQPQPAFATRSVAGADFRLGECGRATAGIKPLPSLCRRRCRCAGRATNGANQVPSIGYPVQGVVSKDSRKGNLI